MAVLEHSRSFHHIPSRPVNQDGTEGWYVAGAAVCERAQGARARALGSTEECEGRGDTGAPMERMDGDASGCGGPVHGGCAAPHPSDADGGWAYWGSMRARVRARAGDRCGVRAGVLRRIVRCVRTAIRIPSRCRASMGLARSHA